MTPRLASDARASPAPGFTVHSRLPERRRHPDSPAGSPLAKVRGGQRAGHGQAHASLDFQELTATARPLDLTDVEQQRDPKRSSRCILPQRAFEDGRTGISAMGKPGEECWRVGVTGRVRAKGKTGEKTPKHDCGKAFPIAAIRERRDAGNQRQDGAARGTDGKVVCPEIAKSQRNARNQRNGEQGRRGAHAPARCKPRRGGSALAIGW